MSVTINGTLIENPNNIPQVQGAVTQTSDIEINDPLKIYTGTNVILWVTQTLGHSPVQMTANEIGSTKWENNTSSLIEQLK